ALGLPLADYSPGRMTYDLRRLRLHGLIERIPQSHRYRVTDAGLRVALFFTKLHSRILRPGLSQLFEGTLELRSLLFSGTRIRGLLAACWAFGATPLKWLRSDQFR
ncbi:MAG: hypothetical protein AADX98_28285, partial [Thiocapsa sp. C3-3m]